MERVTAEGLLSLSKETVRGNEYYVFGEAPKKISESIMNWDWLMVIGSILSIKTSG